MSRDSENANSTDTAAIRELFQSDNRNDFVSAVRMAAGRILKSLHVEEDRLDEILNEVEGRSLYQDFRDCWEDLAPEERSRKWRLQMEHIVQTAYACRPYCLRCGDCCSRVSPSLHPEDLDLVKSGILGYADLYTLRKGEPVLNNITGALENLSGELVKLKENPGNRQCPFYEEQEKSCRIYEHRPLQCRTQECWNPQALEKLWEKEKLTRRDILKGDAEILELLEVHEQRCSTEKADGAIKKYWETGEAAELDPVLDLLSQDLIIRNFFTERLGRGEEELDFLLGRPLSKVVEAYRLKVEKDEQGTFHLVQIED
ncbi:MAG: YkgJ family cysteine cluster protein [Acidobacteria bacterium]|nr:YkgJ family cysteine cluster protein [Acidobacteriota bacterium]